MLVGLVGAQRTGKTTLAKACSKEYNIEFAETSTSAVFKNLGYSPKIDYDFKTRMVIQNHILDSAEEVYHGIKKEAIADRTPLDMLAYTLADIRRENLSEADNIAFKEYKDRCFNVTNDLFSSVILIQSGIPIKDEADKAPTGIGYMYHIETIMKSLLVDEALFIDSLIVKSTVLNLKDRVDCVDYAIKSSWESLECLSISKLKH